jgi:hypothetical protein
MVTRAIKRYVDVEIRKDTPAVSAAGFGDTVIITDNVLLSTTRRYRAFTDDTSVGAFFGTDSEEYKAANAYYNQDPFNTERPNILGFGAFCSSPRGALLEMGDSPQTDLSVWQAVTDGEFAITVDGSPAVAVSLDFSSVTSLDDVATVIDTAITLYASCYFLANRFNIRSKSVGSSSTISLLSTVGGGLGTDISGAGFLDGDTPYSVVTPGGSYLSQGCGSVATSAKLISGDFTEDNLTPELAWNTLGLIGEFQITIDGVNTQAVVDLSDAFTTMDQVAFAINTQVPNGTVIWNSSTSRFEITSNTTGITSTITYASTVTSPVNVDISGNLSMGLYWMDAALPENNVTITQGAAGSAGETFEEALTAIENVNNDWYAMSAVKSYRDSSYIEEMADSIESRRKMFYIATNDPNVLVFGNTSTSSYYVKNANYRRTGFIYHDNEALYIDMSDLGLQLPKPIGSTNWAYQTLAGTAQGALVDITPVVMTEAQKDAALSVNCNIYTTTSADFTYKGTMGGGRDADKNGEYIDIVRNIDFLQARIEEGQLNLFLTSELIPMTDPGIAAMDNQLNSDIDTYGIKQGIIVEGSVKTFFPRRVDISQADRDARKLPDGTFSADLQGAIDTVTIRGTVFV